MKQMKYIVVDNGSWIAPVIFSEATQHFEMAQNVHGEIISAGFIRWTPDGMECYGQSISLGVKANPEGDTKLINKELGVPND